MAGGRFAKQANFRAQLFNSNNANDSVIGGALSVSPLNSNIGSQAWQNYPGDRVILSPLDAVAVMNNSVGNLYTGTYRYVQPANSTAAPTRGHAAFWLPLAFNNNQAVQDALYQVTSDEVANYNTALFAGVFLNSPGKGNNNVYWWIQESGKAGCVFRTTLSANGNTGVIGAGVYLTGAGNNNNAQDIGSFDQITGLNSGVSFAANTAGANSAWTAIDSYLTKFVGVAEQLPVANNTTPTAVDIDFRGIRW